MVKTELCPPWSGHNGLSLSTASPALGAKSVEKLLASTTISNMPESFWTNNQSASPVDWQLLGLPCSLGGVVLLSTTGAQ